MSTPVGPYSPYVIAEPFVFCSGQIGLDNGQLSGEIAAETKACLINLKSVLSQVNLSLEDIVKTTVFMADMKDYTSMNEAYVKEFGDHRPARSAIAVKELPLGALIEIEAIAKLK